MRELILCDRIIVGASDDQIAVATNDGEQIIEVVGYATGQPANGFHALGLQQLCFEMFLLGGIDGHSDDEFGFALTPAHQTQMKIGGNSAAIPEDVTFVLADLVKFASRYLGV